MPNLQETTMSSAASILQGKRVLITGGAGGLGRAVVSRMIEQGARILIADRHEPDLQKTCEAARQSWPTGEIDYVAADLSDSGGITRMFERVDSWLGGLDMLVACAGVGSGP